MLVTDFSKGMRMSLPRRYVFVLWAAQFEEAPAAIFVTTLRQAGLRVKVVGLTARPTSGSHGLTLTPDLTLDQALPLAAEAVCLVIPQGTAGLQSLKNEPRLQKFFELLGKNQAGLVIGPFQPEELGDWLADWGPEQVLIYPHEAELIPFVHNLAQGLQEEGCLAALVRAGQVAGGKGVYEIKKLHYA
jgi:hypothetical protein